MFLSQPPIATNPSKPWAATTVSIALWVDRQCSLLMSGEGRLAGLVEINGNIIAGLAGEAATGMAQEEA